MNEQRPLHMPETQPAFAGVPPRPPKKTARDLEDGSPQEPHIDIPDPVVVRDLATTLREKPFKIVADIMRFGVFVYAEETVCFETASRVAWKHGFYARRVE